MTARLIISSNNAQNPLTLDLSQYIRLADGEGVDPYDPAFSEKVIAHSLLREGGVLALEDLRAKELVFPLALNAPLSAVTNLVPTPTFGRGLGTWSTTAFGSMNVGATISQVADSSAPSGAGSAMKVVTTSALAAEGAGILCPGTFVSGQAYKISVFLRGNAGGEAVKIFAGDNVGGDFGTLNVSLTSAYQRLSFTYTPASNHTNFFVAVATQAATAVAFFVDSVMIQSGSALSTYVDGDQLGCTWNGPPGASTSTAPGGLSQTVTMVQQLNQAVATAGVTFSWQDTGLSQPTIFDGITGQFDVEYSYRQHEKFWVKGKLRLFSQPFGRTAAPRLYATASGVGPLLMISPYASGGANVLGASTQAGISGYGGQQQASGGVFYAGSPELAGDAAAILQISYVGPLPSASTGAQAQVPGVPFALVSLLPDQFYRPLIGATELTTNGYTFNAFLTGPFPASTAVGGAYFAALSGGASNTIVNWKFAPYNQASYAGQVPGPAAVGQHRLLAIARASGAGPAAPALYQADTNLLTSTASATVPLNLDWGLYDLGTFSIRPSQFPGNVYVTGLLGAPSQALDLSAFVILPDNATWALNPTALQANASQYGIPAAWGTIAMPPAPYTNTLILDDVCGIQSIFSGGSQTSAPSPIGSAPSSTPMTQFTRGLVPRPDPRAGLPIIAILGVQPNSGSPRTLQVAPFNPQTIAGGSWANPQNLRTMAQVNVLERTRYVFG